MISPPGNPVAPASKARGVAIAARLTRLKEAA